MKGHV